MKQAFMVKLDEKSAEFVEKQAMVFESNSRVIALMVTVTRILIELGIVKWEFGWLQELLQRNEGNHRNPVTNKDAGKVGALGGSSPALAPRRISTTSQRNRLTADAVATGAMAWKITPFLAACPATRMLQP